MLSEDGRRIPSARSRRLCSCAVRDGREEEAERSEPQALQLCGPRRREEKTERSEPQALQLCGPRRREEETRRSGQQALQLCRLRSVRREETGHSEQQALQLCCPGPR